MGCSEGCPFDVVTNVNIFLSKVNFCQRYINADKQLVCKLHKCGIAFCCQAL